jgi:hypothetical protein
MKDGTMIRSALNIMHRFGLNVGSGRRAAITVALALALASLAGSAQASVLTAGAPSAVAAATQCKTISWDATLNDSLGLRLASITVSTYFCYNNVLVTYHDTSYTVNVSGVGSAGGWNWDGLVSNDFNCYVTDGSTNKCGKNTEVLEGLFQDCVVKVGCIANWFPVIQEDEYFNGDWVIWVDGNEVSYGY